MRENLFHGKRKDTGEWVEGYYCAFNGVSHRIYTGYAETDCGEFYPDYYEVIPETVGQYAVATDKNSTKIFEGDICKVTMFTCEGEDKHYLCEVCFDCGSFVFRERSGFDILPVDIYDFETDVEVIGNIYDNPELIGGETNERRRNLEQM